MSASDDREVEGTNVPCLVGTLGMFIIDQFRFEDEKTGEDLGDRGLGTHIGGGGTYFTIGARMWLLPSKVLMIVDRGHDLSDAEKTKLDMYAGEGAKGGHALWRHRDRHDGQGTTRAVNIYRGEERGFAYLTPKLRLDPADLVNNAMPTLPIFIHCICSPSRVLDICSQIDAMRYRWYNGKRPKIVWEPIPDSAIPENLDDCLEAYPLLDVISPNHEEAASFLSVSKATLSGMAARDAIEELLIEGFYERAAAAGIRKVPLICIRSGAHGAVLSSSREEAMWVDAYHDEKETNRIVDVTGAGNAWLGGFTAGLAMQKEAEGTLWTTQTLHLAAQLGSISASLVIEQQSLPRLTVRPDGKELWNGETVQSRLRRLQERSR